MEHTQKSGNNGCLWLSTPTEEVLPIAEILTRIFSHLPKMQDIMSAACVCKLWRAVIYTQTLTKQNLLPQVLAAPFPHLFKPPIYRSESMPKYAFVETKQGLLRKKWDVFWELRHRNIPRGKKHKLPLNERYTCKVGNEEFRPYYTYTTGEIAISYPIKNPALGVEWISFSLPRQGDVVQVLVDNVDNPQEFHCILRFGNYFVFKKGNPNIDVFCLRTFFENFALNNQASIDFRNLTHFSICHCSEDEWNFLLSYTHVTLEYNVFIQTFFDGNRPAGIIPFQLTCLETDVWEDRFDLSKVEETKDYYATPIDFNDKEYGWVVVDKRESAPQRFINLGSIDYLVQYVVIEEKNLFVAWRYNGECFLISLESGSATKLQPLRQLHQSEPTTLLDMHSMPGGNLLIATKNENDPQIYRFIIFDIEADRHVGDLYIEKASPIWTMDAQMVAILDRKSDVLEIYDIRDSCFIKRGDFIFNFSTLNTPTINAEFRFCEMKILNSQFLLLKTETTDGSYMCRSFIYSLKDAMSIEIENDEEQDLSLKSAGQFFAYATPYRKTDERLLTIVNSKTGKANSYLGDSLLPYGRGTIHSFEILEEEENFLLDVYIKIGEEGGEKCEKVTLLLG